MGLGMGLGTGLGTGCPSQEARTQWTGKVSSPSFKPLSPSTFESQRGLQRAQEDFWERQEEFCVTMVKAIHTLLPLSKLTGWAWWHKPLGPALGRQRQVDLGEIQAAKATEQVPGQLGLCSETLKCFLVKLVNSVRICQLVHLHAVWIYIQVEARG